jgi:WD40 repeat protein
VFVQFPVARVCSSVVLAVVVAGCSGNTSSPAATPSDPGTFTVTGAMTDGYANGSSATLLPDGRVLIGGDGSKAQLYDPKTGTFGASGATNAEFGPDHTATLLQDGTVLVISDSGGSTADAATAGVWDPAADTLSPAAPMLSGSFAPSTATLLQDGRVLCMGGGQASLFDPSTGVFTPTGSMSASRRDGVAAVLQDGRVLITGGHDGTVALASAEMYDPTTGSFSSTGSMSTVRSSPYGGVGSDYTATVLSDGRVLVTGGEGRNQILNSAELYDPKTGTFSPTGSMSASREHHTATLLPDGRVLVAGGKGTPSTAGDGPSGPVLASAELYEPATGKFTLAASMAIKRSFHSAALLADGRVLVAGGRDDSSQGLTSAELFKTSTTPTLTPGSPSARLTRAPAYTGGPLISSSGNVYKLTPGSRQPGEEFATYPNEDGATVGWSADGKRRFTDKGQLSTAGKEAPEHLTVGDGVTSANFSPDAFWLAYTTKDGAVVLRNLAARTSEVVLQTPCADYKRETDGSKLTVCGGAGGVVWIDQASFVVRHFVGKMPDKLIDYMNPSPAANTSSILNTAGKVVSNGGYVGSPATIHGTTVVLDDATWLDLSDWKAGKPGKPLPAGAEVHSLSPDGSSVVVPGDSAWQLVDLRTGQAQELGMRGQIGTSHAPGYNPIDPFVWSPDGKYFAVQDTFHGYVLVVPVSSSAGPVVNIPYLSGGGSSLDGVLIGWAP